ncbi:hypothetical protein ACHAWF_011252 [Thalassiosira exigua]
MTEMSSYHPMTADDDNDIANFASWDSQRLGLFFRRKGLGAYEPVLAQHKITGRLAPLLTDDDLKDMGMDVVGDRLAFKLCLKELSRRERFHKRIQCLWSGTERLFHSECERAMFTCGGLCPVDPSTYRLTTNHLKVNRVQPIRCGPIPLCCFGTNRTTNNIDLSKVDDVDVTGVPAPCMQRVCCCAQGIDRVQIESRFEKGGKIVLTVNEGDGEGVANMIINQVEESQKMERTV